ncbi:hypothetical protein C2S51_008838 [Perilla frutescens var. frutescens]|nr:hypothetical protein C2S51_008838 [Perilla frutescens var. frutescens]
MSVDFLPITTRHRQQVRIKPLSSWKAVTEALNQRIESAVGDFLSSIGRLQAEQQNQVQEFQSRFPSASGAIAQFVFKDLWTDRSSIASQLTQKFNSLDTRVSNLESVISNKPISPQVICICNDLYVPALRPLRQVAKTPCISGWSL